MSSIFDALEFPYKGKIFHVIQGKGSHPDTETLLYDGIMDEHMVKDEEGRTLQTSSCIVSIPLKKNRSGEYIIPKKGDIIHLTRYGEKIKLTIDNVEPSQVGGISLYATRNSW